jgi:hypothetical protein
MLAAVITSITAILGGVVILWTKYIRPAWRYTRTTISGVRDLTELALYQFRPNSGHSVVDTLERIEKRQLAVERLHFKLENTMVANHHAAETHWKALEQNDTDTRAIISSQVELLVKEIRDGR